MIFGGEFRINFAFLLITTNEVIDFMGLLIIKTRQVCHKIERKTEVKIYSSHNQYWNVDILVICDAQFSKKEKKTSLLSWITFFFTYT